MSRLCDEFVIDFPGDFRKNEERKTHSSGEKRSEKEKACAATTITTTTAPPFARGWVIRALIFANTKNNGEMSRNGEMREKVNAFESRQCAAARR